MLNFVSKLLRCFFFNMNISIKVPLQYNLNISLPVHYLYQQIIGIFPGGLCNISSAFLNKYLKSGLQYGVLRLSFAIRLFQIQLALEEAQT